MSTTPEMGLSGSVEQKQETEQVPLDTNSDNQLQKAVEVNNIINSAQTDDITDSLESEIEALSSLITDTKDGAGLEGDNDVNIKLDSVDPIFSKDLQCDTIENESSKKPQDNTTGISVNSGNELDNFISEMGVENNLQEVLGETKSAVENTGDVSDSNKDQETSSLNVPDCNALEEESSLLEEGEQATIQESTSTEEAKTESQKEDPVNEKIDKIHKEPLGENVLEENNESKDVDQPDFVQTENLLTKESEIEIGSIMKNDNDPIVLETKEAVDKAIEEDVLKPSAKIDDVTDCTENKVENLENVLSDKNTDNVNKIIDDDCADVSTLKDSENTQALEECLNENLADEKLDCQNNVESIITNMEVVQYSNTDALKESITNEDSNNGTLEDVESIKEDIFAEDNGIEVAKIPSENIDISSAIDVNKDASDIERDDMSLDSMSQNDELKITNVALDSTIIQSIESLESSFVESKSEDSSACNKISAEESLEQIRVETPEDLKITLELDKQETVGKINDDVKVTVDEEARLQESFVQKEDSQEKKEEAEFNLSLDPEECSSPIDEDDKAMEGSLIQPDNCDNANDVEMNEVLETKEENSNPVLDDNQKIDDAISNSQNSISQEAISDFNAQGGNFDTDVSELIGTESTAVEGSENANLPQMTLSSNEESQDSMPVVDTLQSELISDKLQKKESNKLSETSPIMNTLQPEEDCGELELAEKVGDENSEMAEKEEDMSLIFEDSNQSSIQPQGDIFIDECNKASEDITECNEQISKEENRDNNDKQTDEQLKSDVQSSEKEIDDLQNIVDDIETEKEIDQPTEISELESAVKFLQESVEQEVQDTTAEDSSTNQKSSDVFVPIEDGECDNASEMMTETNVDPIAISEAEIISEAAKLESERKEKLGMEQQTKSSAEISSVADDLSVMEESALPAAEADPLAIEETDEKMSATSDSQLEDDTPKIPDVEVKDSSDLETTEETEIVSDEIITAKSSVATQKEIRQRLESPERVKTTSEPKISETPKKESSEKQQQHLECENVGSPRIILKIAKAAIADCSEPRSPKSPKIRSAANSPNPEESSGQKLGKIKLKLSKGGHPSIISNDKYEEAQWHTENTSSFSSHGMKIKITKTTETLATDEGKHEETHIVEETKKVETSLGMKIKFSKSGDASIVQQDSGVKEAGQDVKQKHKQETVQETTTAKKQDSPSIGMKIKLSKSGDASIIPLDEDTASKHRDKSIEDVQESVKRTESPIGMKIKFSKSGDASVVSNEPIEPMKEVVEAEDSLKRTDSPIGMKIKLSKTKDGNASIIMSEGLEDPIATSSEVGDESIKASLGMKIKLSKTGDASVVQLKKEDSHSEVVKKSTEQPIGMKIKLSKTGDPSIIHSEIPKEHFKIKDQPKAKEDAHIEMKIKLSKTGHHTIVTNEPQEDPLKLSSISVAHSHKHKDLLSLKESTLKTLKKSHSDVSIEPVNASAIESTVSELHSKRKEITIAPVEPKKSKLEMNLKQMFPDITIQPITAAQQQQLQLDSKSGSISRQQMKVINQEISITQICSTSTSSTLQVQTEQQASSSPFNSDCEIIDPQPELIIVNENSNSSQDVMIIDELPTVVQPVVKVPRKRGRPRRNPLPVVAVQGEYQPPDMARDPLSLDHPPVRQQQSAPVADGAERPRRTCRSQKSYAPPKRGGRGRGRGKRKNEAVDIPAKKQRIEHDLTALEKSTTATITLQKFPLGHTTTAAAANVTTTTSKAPELFKALSQPTLEQVAAAAQSRQFHLGERAHRKGGRLAATMPTQQTEQDLPEDDDVVEMTEISQENANAESVGMAKAAPAADSVEEMILFDKDTGRKSSAIEIKVTDENDKQMDSEMTENWLAPSIKKISSEPATRAESISTLTVIDEETRMSAESGSRSQTPARNIAVAGTAETFVNEESQNSVLSTATTESEKVKTRTRRMEIIVDPDDGPFTVDKLAEYEWPLHGKDGKPVRGETYMIQEQISQYLGVKSFKRKYPNIQRRMVDMEERNYVRENGLVSESMCDMGLTAVSSHEVLDIMCNDFPEQYEEYRKYIREKAAKEHLKKQKELSAAANAERNRIDLAEMAMQSAISYNSELNKTRQDTRKCSLDLQTFTVQVPSKRTVKYDSTKRGNHYPVSVIPGQYTDYYREYKPAELRYYPINTVLYGPMRPNERKFDSQSDGSQSDSDSDSSSDDSSSSSSEGTQDSENSQLTMEEVDMEIAAQSDLKCKMCLSNLNKSNRPEVLVQCGTCSGNVHPSCIDLTVDMVPHIRAYAWQCTDCKTCAQCHDPADEDKMLFCDMCDRGYHIYCVGLRRVPQGRWHCQECALCSNCGAKEPGGATQDRNSVAQWQHEYKRGDKNSKVYVSTFCVPCSKLWIKGRYCPHCNRCHNAPQLDSDPNLIHCGACDKYLHQECVEIKGLSVDKKNYVCEYCSSKQHQEKQLISKALKT